MILKEQLYKKHKRIYYHGYPEWYKETLKSCPEFYLTTNFIYACTYAGEKGVVDTFTFKKDLNIFNAQAEKDYNTLEIYLKEKYPILLKYLPRLKYEDWSLSDPMFQKVRGQLIKGIKTLRYDGYFNYEIDKELLKLYRKNHCDYVNPVLIENPSIGVFDENNLIKIDTMNGYESFKKEKAFSDFKKKELYYIQYRILKLYEEGKYNSENIEKEIMYLSQILFCFKDPNEIEKYILSWDIGYLISHKEEAFKTFDYLKENVIKRYPIFKDCYSDGYFSILKLNWEYLKGTLPNSNVSFSTLKENMGNKKILIKKRRII